MQKFMTLRLHGPHSIGFTVPIRLLRELDLGIGDAVLWETKGEVVTLKFFRRSREPAEQEQQPVEELSPSPP